LNGSGKTRTRFLTGTVRMARENNFDRIQIKKKKVKKKSLFSSAHQTGKITTERRSLLAVRCQVVRQCPAPARSLTRHPIAAVVNFGARDGRAESRCGQCSRKAPRIRFSPMRIQTRKPAHRFRRFHCFARTCGIGLQAKSPAQSAAAACDPCRARRFPRTVARSATGFPAPD